MSRDRVKLLPALLRRNHPYRVSSSFADASVALRVMFLARALGAGASTTWGMLFGRADVTTNEVTTQHTAGSLQKKRATVEGASSPLRIVIASISKLLD